MSSPNSPRWHVAATGAARIRRGPHGTVQKSKPDSRVDVWPRLQARPCGRRDDGGPHHRLNASRESGPLPSRALCRPSGRRHLRVVLSRLKNCPGRHRAAPRRGRRGRRDLPPARLPRPGSRARPGRSLRPASAGRARLLLVGGRARDHRVRAGLDDVRERLRHAAHDHGISGRLHIMRSVGA